MELNDIFIARVTSELSNRGMTKTELVERAGIDRSTLTKVFSGRAQVSLSTVDRIAKGLGLEAFQLLEQGARSSTVLRRRRSV